ncbi:MAG: hypothetical protein R2939_12795 [Kofleriaceae bacterium]
MPVLTDVHEDTPVDEVAAVVDVLQTPAFLVRQTDFMQRVACAGKPVNIKKGCSGAVGHGQRRRSAAPGNHDLMVCERGCRSLQHAGRRHAIAGDHARLVASGGGCVRDATHSVQQLAPGQIARWAARDDPGPGVRGRCRRRRRVHGDPPRPHEEVPGAMAQTQPLARAEEPLTTLLAIDAVVKARPVR